MDSPVGDGDRPRRHPEGGVVVEVLLSELEVILPLGTVQGADQGLAAQPNVHRAELVAANLCAQRSRLGQ